MNRLEALLQDEQLARRQEEWNQHEVMRIKNSIHRLRRVRAPCLRRGTGARETEQADAELDSWGSDPEDESSPSSSTSDSSSSASSSL